MYALENITLRIYAIITLTYEVGSPREKSVFHQYKVFTAISTPHITNSRAQHTNYWAPKSMTSQHTKITLIAVLAVTA